MSSHGCRERCKADYEVTKPGPGGAGPTEHAGSLKPAPVLGGRVDLDSRKHFVGVGLVLVDPDKVIRNYQRQVSTANGPPNSFSYVVARTALREEEVRLSQLDETSRQRQIDFRGDRTGSHRLRLPASKALELSQNWPQGSPVRDRIVVLGGSYADQDRHDTPLGRMKGSDIVAAIVDTETKGGGSALPASPLPPKMDA